MNFDLVSSIGLMIYFNRLFKWLSLVHLFKKLITHYADLLTFERF